MTDPMARTLTRRGALRAGAALTAGLALATGPLGALPALADELESRGYALGDMTLGDENAPVTIIEYSSLTCPHCASFHTNTWPEIKANYVDTGKARLIFREVYFDQYGLWASMISRCGGEATFFGYIDTFLKRQQEWARAEDIVAEMQRIGRLGGLPAERIQACLTDEDFMNRLVGDFQQNAGADAVRSTPTFIINGQTATGAMSVAEFSALIDRHL
jgi:protein-disulfide isomerase